MRIAILQKRATLDSNENLYMNRAECYPTVLPTKELDGAVKVDDGAIRLYAEVIITTPKIVTEGVAIKQVPLKNCMPTQPSSSQNKLLKM